VCATDGLYSSRKKAIRAPCEGKPHARCDEGAVETGPMEYLMRHPSNRKGRETRRGFLKVWRHCSTLPRNMVKALWVHVVTGEFGIPAVYKPEAMIRELRKLFSQYQLLNRQIRVLKNNIQAVCTENGMNLTRETKNKLLSMRWGKETVLELDVSNASVLVVHSCLELLWKVQEEKEKIRKEILVVGEPLKEAMKMLMTIKGVAPIVALAFLTDIGDVKRFKTLRKMNAYLGLVPKAKESGGKTKTGHINRESRKLTRTLLS